MENLSGDMPSLKPTQPNNEPLIMPVPEVAAEPAVDTKKPFFTFGKIMAIFGVLLIVGTIVGAVIYSRSSERLQGDLLTVNKVVTDQGIKTTTTDAIISERTDVAVTNADLTGTAEINKNLDKTDATIATNDATLNISDRVVVTTDRVTTTTTTSSVCDTALNRVPVLSAITAAYVPPTCICKDGFVSLLPNDKCVEIDYCAITDKELNAYLSSNSVSEATKKMITAVTGGSLIKYQEKNCPKLTLVTEFKPLELNIPDTTTTLNCTAPLTNQTSSTTEYCMCPSNTYPVVTLSGIATAYVPPTTECVPFACPQLTTDQLSKITETIKSILAKQELSAAVTDNIVAKFNSEYSAWSKANPCTPPVVTCADLKTNLANAYYKGDWTKYAEVLKQMVATENCITPCELSFYNAVFYLSQGKLDQANKYLDEYLKTCTNECSIKYGILSLYAETLSKIEQSQTLTAASAIRVTSVELARLKDMVVKYKASCGCDGIAKFLKTPEFPAKDYFGSATSASTLRTSNLNSSNVLRIAYAQSLSSSVKGVIEDVYKDLCVPPVKNEEPKSCTKLTITQPSSTGSYEMSRDFNPTRDYLKFTVDNNELVTGYKISSGTVKFDGSDNKTITTDKMEVSMSGGPAEGSGDTITVTALEGGSTAVTHFVPPTETCSATLKLTRPKTPPTTKPDPACRSLEIISPIDAAMPGVPTFELPEGKYTNKLLEIKVAADAGSVKDYKYESAKGYIKFDGQTTFYTTNKTVLMNGVIPEGETDTISVWARNMSSKGIPTCNDGFVVTVPEEETPPPTEEVPPPTEEVPPPVTITEEEPDPTIEEVVIPGTEPVIVPVTEPVKETVHAAAPESPQTGPGVLIYLIGAGLGGALLRRINK